MRIGLDFDNTLVSYDQLFPRLAEERGWLPPGEVQGKAQVRARLWAKPEGDLLWQALQADAYGPRIREAALFPGVPAFLAAARAQGHALFVVSHKTATASLAPNGPDLRQAARDFLAHHGLLGGVLPPENVFFESTRAEKIARIANLTLTVYVDDLPEVLTDPAFPATVRRCLFQPDPTAPPDPTALSPYHTWEALRHDLLGA